MATATGVMTIADFESLPDDAARNKELVNGELVEVPGNYPEHAFLRDDLLVAMTPPVRRSGGRITTELLFDFDGESRAPDLAYIGPGKLPAVETRRIQQFVPDLAVEIAGEYDGFQDLFAKARHYLRCGTLEVWLISIRSRELIRLTAAGGEILEDSAEVRTALLPEFSFRLGELIDAGATPRP